MKITTSRNSQQTLQNNAHDFLRNIIKLQFYSLSIAIILFLGNVFLNKTWWYICAWSM